MALSLRMYVLEIHLYHLSLHLIQWWFELSNQVLKFKICFYGLDFRSWWPFKNEKFVIIICIHARQRFQVWVLLSYPIHTITLRSRADLRGGGRGGMVARPSMPPYFCRDRVFDYLSRGGGALRYAGVHKCEHPFWNITPKQILVMMQNLPLHMDFASNLTP